MWIFKDKVKSLSKEGIAEIFHYEIHLPPLTLPVPVPGSIVILVGDSGPLFEVSIGEDSIVT